MRLELVCSVALDQQQSRAAIKGIVYVCNRNTVDGGDARDYLVYLLDYLVYEVGQAGNLDFRNVIEIADIYFGLWEAARYGLQVC